MSRRVVITGLGLLTPLGNGVEVSWKRLIAGQSGAGLITAFDTTDYACKIACEIPTVDGRGGGAPGQEGAFDAAQLLSSKERRKIDYFILYAIAAADEAVKDSGWVPETEEDRDRTGVMIGSGIGGLGMIAATAIELQEKGPKRISPFFIPSSLINLASGQVSIRHGFKGPNHAVVTACATGALLTTSRAELPGPMTATATALSWARAPVSSSSKNMNMPRLVEPRFMPRSRAMAYPGTPIISPRLPKMVMAAYAP